MGVNYSHSKTLSNFHTCSTTVSDTITVPSQNIKIQPHTVAYVFWRLGQGNVDLDYTFQAPLPDDIATTMEISGRLVDTVDEVYHPGNYRAFDSDMVLIKPQRVVRSLYTLLKPEGGGALHQGLILDAAKGEFMLSGSGTAHIKGVVQLDVMAKECPIINGNEDCSKTKMVTLVKNVTYKKHNSFLSAPNCN